MKELNLHSLFCGSRNPPCFLKKISISENDDEMFQDARRVLRAFLRQHLTGIEITFNNIVYKIPRPQFFTQGSYAYLTLNAPNRPPQQADLDEGLYLPLSEILRLAPANVSKQLINIIGRLLKQLADREGWEYENKNDNCDRLIIAPDKHIDVPIYSVPDTEFRRLYEAKLVDHTTSYEDFTADDQWDYLPTEHVLMAHKSKGWIKSDPRPVVEWVKSQVARKGQQFRYSVRFIKAWRDEYRWKNEDPKSIFLMAAMGEFFHRQVENRTDLAFYNAVKEFHEYLESGSNTPIPNPADPSQDLAKKLDDDGIRQEFETAIKNLYLKLRNTIFECGDPKEVCQTMQLLFGHRFPNNPELIAIATVLSTKAKRIKAVTAVGTLTSG
jgi:cyclic GMP-AMP synthase